MERPLYNHTGKSAGRQKCLITLQNTLTNISTLKEPPNRIPGDDYYSTVHKDTRHEATQLEKLHEI